MSAEGLRWFLLRSETYRKRDMFSLHELSGSLGDLGIFIPLVVGLSSLNGLSSSAILSWFGFFFVISGLSFGLPLVIQPMKAIATLAISHGYQADVVGTAGLLTGVAILAITLGGLVGFFQRIIPRAVIRGIQLGLGISLGVKGVMLIAQTSLFGFDSIILAVFSMIVLASSTRKVPTALIVSAVGIVFALLANQTLLTQLQITLWMPKITLPSFDNLGTALEMTVAQIPLTLTNSLLATHALLASLYLKRCPKIRSIGLNIGVMSTIASLFGGLGMCHGAGGIAGWHRFGARTGGSMIMFGIAMLVLGLFFGEFALGLMQAFPVSILGALLIFVALELSSQIKDTLQMKSLVVVALTALAGFAINMTVGVVLGLVAAYFMKISK